ncbi:uncharacterized protein TNCV_1012771 [Trichonephila clavipes]|uniref:Uncharacterized protein n=1 Tax=Trichonephila clavipes TaxID=2585209 RepID=A0A8X7B9I0_TRICX|nr:uncharacterized protein TNCV_1012771 [Trichonephila clavipes]
MSKAYGRSSLVVKVSDRGWLVPSASPVPLKTRRVGKRCTLNLSRAQTSSHRCGNVAFLGFWTVKTVLNPISGQFFDEGHGESGVLRSAEWHDGDWLDDGIREAWLLCFVRMVDFQKFLPWLRAK